MNQIPIDKKECVDCKHRKCFNDGDDRWDLWCDENPSQGLDNEFNNNLAETCDHYNEDEVVK